GLHVLQIRELVDAGAADDGECDGIHDGSSSCGVGMELLMRKGSAGTQAIDSREAVRRLSP
ncbi:MAG: hypothetical protein ACREO0_10255, partial [Pseudoxanthomonas sp.]